jgi:hypothetical protein
MLANIARISSQRVVHSSAFLGSSAPHARVAVVRDRWIVRFVAGRSSEGLNGHSESSVYVPIEPLRSS